MKRSLCNCLLLLCLGLTACASTTAPVERTTQLPVVTLDSTVKIVAGQTVYVPIYSHIYTWEQSRTMNLTATLSIRNTDPAHPVIVAAVNYYDSDGKLVRNYLNQPGELGPLASEDFVVDQEDTSGGSGASFLVEWVAQQVVSAPVIEAIMINATGNQGISFISSGRVIKNRTEGNLTGGSEHD